MRLLNHRSDLDNSRRRLMRRQLRAHQVNRVLQHNNHPRAGQFNPAHQDRAFRVNHRRVPLVNRRRVSQVNHCLARQDFHRPEPLREHPLRRR